MNLPSLGSRRNPPSWSDCKCRLNGLIHSIKEYGFRPADEITLYERNGQTHLMKVVTFEAVDAAGSARIGAGHLDATHLRVTSSYAIESSYYYTKDGPVPCTVSFVVAVEPVSSSRTTVSVRSIDVQIYNGKTFGGHSLSFIPRPIPVQPVAAEEYKLPVYIAHVLGTSLPPLKTYVNG